MHDLKQLAKDAERVEASAKAWLSEYDLDRDEIEYHEAERRLAAFVADLMDETPLTVEGLVACGFKKGGSWGVEYVRGKIGVGSTLSTVDLWWWCEERDAMTRWPICPAPRTVGELAMIELLMEGR